MHGHRAVCGANDDARSRSGRRHDVQHPRRARQPARYHPHPERHPRGPRLHHLPVRRGGAVRRHLHRHRGRHCGVLFVDDAPPRRHRRPARRLARALFRWRVGGHRLRALRGEGPHARGLRWQHRGLGCLLRRRRHAARHSNLWRHHHLPLDAHHLGLTLLDSQKARPAPRLASRRGDRPRREPPRRSRVSRVCDALSLQGGRDARLVKLRD
mmetsp:Transcript_20951/g.67794  ORF Transcript_20951/g.67794 Transcript_20951/m.67794 type:complete len:212 (+) Transcript_20951:753-1388(+)